MLQYLDFEKSVAELEGKAEELRVLAKDDPDMDIGVEVSQLEEKAQKQLSDLYGKLTPWRRCQVARHPNRPHARGRACRRCAPQQRADSSVAWKRH